ncbi:MAG: threonine/serine dehydratase [Chloroflexota bacterium]|nr:threonine/serine dehydratase [Chloroflexota bacterium]
MTYSFTLQDAAAARARTAPYIRHTPLAPLPLPSTTIVGDDLPAGLRFKLENLQVAGSFKSRGVFNTLLKLSEATRQRGVITASGGNHGLALAYAARALHLPCIVYLPHNAMPDRETRVAAFGARVIRHGATFDDANARAIQHAADEGLAYVHPFNAPDMIEGNTSLALELLDDLPVIDAAVIAIGGGGLIASVAATLKQRNPSVRIIGVEPRGATSMKDSVDAGRVIELPRVTTIADTLAPRAVGELTLALTQQYVDEIVLVDDFQMIDGMRWLWTYLNQLVEPAGAAALTAFLTGKVDLRAYSHPVVIVCGGNANADGVFSAYMTLASEKARALAGE